MIFAIYKVQNMSNNDIEGAVDLGLSLILILCQKSKFFKFC